MQFHLSNYGTKGALLNKSRWSRCESKKTVRKIAQTIRTRFFSTSNAEYSISRLFLPYIRFSNTFKRKDNFSDSTLDYFEVAGGFTDDYDIRRDIIPLRDAEGTLKAYSLKDTRLNPPDDSFKYIITTGFIKDSVLYNLHNAKIYGNIAPLIVVEGFKSVWRLYDYGIYNVVCTMGSFISPGQVELLKIYASKGVIIMYDADKAGRTGAIAGVVALNKLGIPVVDIDISSVVKQETDGPAELSSEIIYGYLNEYIR